MSNLSLRKRVNKRLGLLADKPHEIQGVVGDYSGNVTVPGRPDRVFVRVRGFVTIAEANGLSMVVNAPVMVGYEKRRGHRVYKILGVHGNAGAPSGGAVALPLHHQRHEWNMPGGGDDVVYVNQRQMLNLRVGPGAGVGIVVDSGVTWTGNEWVLTSQATTIDLSASVPVAGRCWVLISVTGDGTIETTVGDTVSSGALTIGDIPPAPAYTEPLAAVQLYAGQTVISEGYAAPDIVDLRNHAEPNRDVLAQGKAVRIVTDSTLITWEDYFLFMNSASNKTVTLPTATGGGQVFVIKNIGAGITTIDADGSETIDGETTQILVQNEAVQIIDYSTGVWAAF